jgi:hypothetical protein
MNPNLSFTRSPMTTHFDSLTDHSTPGACCDLDGRVGTAPPSSHECDDAMRGNGGDDPWFNPAAAWLVAVAFQPMGRPVTTDDCELAHDVLTNNFRGVRVRPCAG